MTDEQKASLKGKDGVSPTVTTSKTGSTATITITDVNGDHVFTLTDAGIETPVSVENGGTGATTAAQARENLGVTLDALGAAKADHTHSNYVSKSGDTMTGVLGMSSDSPMIQFTPTNQVNITSGYVATGADGTVYLQGTRPDGDYRVLHNNVAADDVSYGLTFTGTWGGAYAGYRVFHEGWTIPMANIPFKVAYGSVAASVVSGK